MPDSALAVLESVRRAPNQTMGTVLPTAAVLARAGRPDEAETVIRQFLQSNPGASDNLLHRREIALLLQGTDLSRPLPATDR
jgi:hypothetical protein